MKLRIVNLIHCYSMAEVETMYRRGSITQALFEAYCRVWEWVAPRFGSTAGWKHDAYWKRHGKEAYYRRINRVRAAFGFKLYGPNGERSAV